MVSYETQGFNIPTSAFTFTLERPVNPVRKSLTPVPPSLQNLTHRRTRSRARSLDGRLKVASALVPSSSPPTQTISQRAPSPGLGQFQDSLKVEDIGIIVERNVLHSGTASKLIAVIEDCKALGIREGVELPRLLLVGEHSSGRSSLLENLTGAPVPFMTAQGSRFPIEFKMVNSSCEYEIQSTIVPSGKFTNLNTKKVEDFNGRKALTRPMKEVEFMELLREVSVILDVPPPTFFCESQPDAKLERSSRISSHCLQIKIRGPNLTSISIIEPPGLCQMSGDILDVGLAMAVQNLVEELAKDKKNIIVGVTAAPQQGTWPRFLNIAEKFDPFGERTLGVLTKCDYIFDRESNDFQAALKLAQNTISLPKYRWYAVRNRSRTEIILGISLAAARSMESTIFSATPWHSFTSRLEKGRTGIEALRQGLSNVYVNQIRAELPELTQKIRNQLGIKKKELLVAKEVTSKSRRSYLRFTVNEYRSRADECLNDETIEEAKPSSGHLMVQLESSTQTFSDGLSSKGTTRAFHSATDWGDFNSAIAASSRSAGDLAAESNVYTWINERYQNRTGDNIPGCISPSLILELFNEQMSPWEKLTDDFITAVSRAFREVVAECFQLLQPEDILIRQKCEEVVLKALEAKMGDVRQDCIARSKYQPSQLLQQEVEKRLFEKETREARLKRLKSVTAWMAHPSGLSTTEKLEEYLNCDQHVVFQVHDILKALYNIAVRDYTSWIKMSFLGAAFVKETMGVCNHELFAALSDDEIRALFKPHLEMEKPISDLEMVIGKHELLLRDMEALMKDHMSSSFKELTILNGGPTNPSSGIFGQALKKVYLEPK